MAQRRRRYGIPKVNQNPRPPNEPKTGGTQAPRGPGGTTAVGGAQALPPRRQGVAQGQALPPRKTPGEQPQQQGPVPAPSSPPALAPPIDPRDSQYWKDYAQLKFNNDLALKNIDVEDTFAKTAFDREQEAREYQKPLEVQHLREQANRAGGIYSTRTQENLGNLGIEQFGKDAQAREAYQYALAQRVGQRGLLKSEFEKNLADLLEGSTERQAKGEIERPALEEEEFESPAVQAMEQRAKKGKQGKGKGKGGGGSAGKGKGGATGKGGGTNAPKSKSNATTGVSAARPAKRRK